jgi:hypothetical protein
MVLNEGAQNDSVRRSDLVGTSIDGTEELDVSESVEEMHLRSDLRGAQSKVDETFELRVDELGVDVLSEREELKID